jgi:hypothetical protein
MKHHDLLERARALLAETGERPRDSDVTELFYRHMGEGSEVGFENAIAEALTRWGPPMTAPLSPAAQAVLDAANNSSAYGPEDCLNEARQIAAAALRAAADQVVPVPIKAQTPEEHWALLGVKNRLLAIADELEAQ